jgi:hypothetical protein
MVGMYGMELQEGAREEVSEQPARIRRGNLDEERSGRDSNPRYGYPYATFPGWCLQPLGHRSRRVTKTPTLTRPMFSGGGSGSQSVV